MNLLPRAIRSDLTLANSAWYSRGNVSRVVIIFAPRNSGMSRALETSPNFLPS